MAKVFYARNAKEGGMGSDGEEEKEELLELPEKVELSKKGNAPVCFRIRIRTYEGELVKAIRDLFGWDSEESESE